MKDKIKNVLKKMLDDGEFERLKDYGKNYDTSDIEEYQKMLEEYGTDQISITALIVNMPKSVAQDVLVYLLAEGQE